MASPSTTFLPSASSSSSLFIFMFYVSMHACISSNARNIRVPDAGSLNDSEASSDQQAGSRSVGHKQHVSPCRRIIRVELDTIHGSESEAKKEEHARTKSGTEVAESSSHVNFINATKTEVSGGSGAARGHEEILSSKSNNDHQEIIEMDYHPPHRNSPIHNK